MQGAPPFRVEPPGPPRRARAGGKPRQVPLDRDAQLLLIALGSLCERDGAAGSGREQSTLTRVPAAGGRRGRSAAPPSSFSFPPPPIQLARMPPRVKRSTACQ